jgi:cyclase
MLRKRIIPTLLLRDEALVKTVKFNKTSYIGDPINTVRIFNELEVDELVFLDIDASKLNKKPNFRVLKEIANECFMPLAYGGGIKDFETASEIFSIGFEKVVLNVIPHSQPSILKQIASHYGNQSVVASVDVKKNFWGKHEVWINSGAINTKKNPTDWCKYLEDIGAGEILLTSIDREGTWTGLDIELTLKITDKVKIPVIAHGGAGNIEHIENVFLQGKASAVALGSMVVFQQKGMGVLVNMPNRLELDRIVRFNNSTI